MTDFDAAARTWDDDPTKVRRARRVADAIVARGLPLGRMTVLEYGCGTGLLGFALAPHVAHVTMADTSPGMLAVVRDKIAASGARNVEARHIDLVEGHMLYERYDLVCTLMTLHHIADTDEILRSFHDVLTPGGTVCICDLDKEDGAFHGEGFTGHNGFDREDLARRLTQAGFVSPDFTTVDEITKQTERGPRTFPLFLAVARKA